MARWIQHALRGLAWFGFSVATASAIGPHEVLLLVNRNSPDSIELANHYRHLRAIPDRNVVLLDVPPEVLNPTAEVSPESFANHIWEPAVRAQEERELNDQIAAWIYSADFPVRITTEPPMSLQGITFVRNQVPEANVIKDGLLVSPLFAGPSHPNRRGEQTASLGRILDLPWEDRPVPSMMLGYTGARGVEPSHIIRSLTTSAQADGTQPIGSVFFVVNDDVRSACRAWAFPAAARELSRLGIDATVTREFPTRHAGIIGIQTGAVSPRLFRGNHYVPGAMAEHLTSFAARFHVKRQAKCSQWLYAGATATCGAVTEPYALWSKFPHPRFFAHYVRGATCLESFYLSVKCPLQLLMLGDPLASPWGPSDTIRVAEVDGNPGTFTVEAAPDATFAFLVDGELRAAGLSDPTYTVALNGMADGAHTLRAVATFSGPLAHRVTAETTFTVNRKRRAVTLGPSLAVPYPDDRPLQLQPSCTLPPDSVVLLKGREEVARVSWEENATLSVLPSMLGRGPSSLHAVAHYADGMNVRSPAIQIHVAAADDPPPPPTLRRVDEPGGSYRLVAKTPSDTTTTWHQVVGPGSAAADYRPSEGTVEPGEPVLIFRPRERFAVCPFPGHHPQERVRAVSAELVVAPDGIGLSDQTAGLAFNYRSEREFDFFALMAQQGEWVLGEFRKGKPNRILQRGAAQRAGKWFRLEVRCAQDDRLEALVNDRVIFSTDRMRLNAGPAGFLAGHRPVRYRDVRASPPFGEGLSVNGNSLVIEKPDGVSDTVVEVEAARRSLRSSRQLRLAPEEIRGLAADPQ